MVEYRGSDGRTYDDGEIWCRLERESWRVCCWDAETGLEVVETDDGELLFLTPTDRRADAFAVEG